MFYIKHFSLSQCIQLVKNAQFQLKVLYFYIHQITKYSMEFRSKFILTEIINFPFKNVIKFNNINLKASVLNVITYQHYMACRYIHIRLYWLLAPWRCTASTWRAWLGALTHCDTAYATKWFWFLRWLARHALAAQILKIREAKGKKK